MDRLILEAAAGVRTLAAGELQGVVEQIAEVGFVDDQPQIAQGKLVGLELDGRIIRKGDKLTTAEAHYLKHVVAEQECPLVQRSAHTWPAVEQLSLTHPAGL